MIEQAIAIVVGGLCGTLAYSVNIWWYLAYCYANKIETDHICTPGYIIAAITGAYLFTKWFC